MPHRPPLQFWPGAAAAALLRPACLTKLGVLAPVMAAQPPKRGSSCASTGVGCSTRGQHAAPLVD